MSSDPRSGELTEESSGIAVDSQDLVEVDRLQFIPNLMEVREGLFL
jgi:hypothetical protein